MKVALIVLGVAAALAVLGFVILRNGSEARTGPPASASLPENPTDAQIKAQLTRVQYHVTKQDGTEPPYANPYWDNKEPGLYVDIIDGSPLFASTTQYKSGTGWPSFWQPLSDDAITTKPDKSLFGTRTEVRSPSSDSHLGHVFEDGPEPTGLRYCLNSAALRFVPAADLEAEGYGEYRRLFDAAS